MSLFLSVPSYSKKEENIELRSSWNTNNTPNFGYRIGDYLLSECDKELKNVKMEAELELDIWHSS